MLTSLSNFQDHQRPTYNALSRVPSPLPRDPSATLPPLALEQLRFDILARLPIPNGYPEEPLHPIITPSKMDLSSFLDQSTGVCLHFIDVPKTVLTRGPSPR